MIKTRRRIFNYDNMNESKIVNNMGAKNELYENSVSATGCLFYKIIDNKVKLMLIKYADPKWPKLDDFGGKIDEPDGSIFDAAMRETEEETNFVISKEMVLEKIVEDNNNCRFYNKLSKYCLHLVRVDNDFFNDTSVFGDFENSDKIYRTVGWYDLNEHKHELAYRLNMNELFDFLNKQI